MITLESFVLLKKLSVRNIQIEPVRIKAEYVVERQDGFTESMELIYSYDTPRFNPSMESDKNLASMILVQVALNYGLFFRTIEFEGVFDQVDRKFILEMMENTSREILVNKLLVRNEFLKPPYDQLEPVKMARYTQADIVFSNPVLKSVDQRSEDMAPDRYVILSSGGKDSLLTYGIIKEIGQAYPVFINEAGRHWFTAVNAYKHFKENEPNTAKPWCNSDRLFNWMLKHFPFIRENYSSVRSDIYPIRLWTVAVFLFGVLPVARNNRAGNILIGDEYDTTVRGSLNGIPHYNGLYDQSRFFDREMTEYYRRKKWGFTQFSILRSMSELLIMKMLVKRYPSLQVHQVSCHAAHKIDEKMYPCGKCEKCRRIVGMLMALEEDPGRCGYSPAQIEQCLKALEKKSVKQLGSDSSHLYFLLVSKKLIAENDFTLKAAKIHPEITKLRFDKERSSLTDMPEYVLEPLFSLLSQYAEGAVKKVDGRWREFDISEEIINMNQMERNRNE